MSRWTRGARCLLGLVLIGSGVLGSLERHPGSSRQINAIYEIARQRNFEPGDPAPAWLEVEGLAKQASDGAMQDGRMLDGRLRLLLGTGFVLIGIEAIEAMLRLRRRRTAVFVGSRAQPTPRDR